SDNALGLPARLRVADLVRVAHHAIHLADVYPLRLRSGRIELNPEGLSEPGDERRSARDARAVRRRTQHLHTAGSFFGDKNVAVRRDAHHAWTLDVAREHVD